MEGDETESKEESFEGCIFCFIASGQDKEAEVVKQVSPVSGTRFQS